jgi:CHAD domain-containing protein
MVFDIGPIKKNIHKLRKFVKKVPRRPNPEEIHDLRTQIRRFQAMIEALDVNCKRNERRLFRHLARIRKRAGKIRDMDVLTGYASTVQVEEERDCLVQLLEYLGMERYRRAEQLHALMRKYGAELQRRLKRSLAHVQKSIPGHSKNGARIRNTAADAMAFVLKLFNELAVPATLNRKNLHAYRLKIKQLRYVLEMADDPNQEFIDKLGEIKDAIGEWHDWEELIAITVEVLDHKANCKLLPEVRAISVQKYENALSLTNKMRRDYLHFSGRIRKRVSISRRRPAVQSLVGATVVS